MNISRTAFFWVFLFIPVFSISQDIQWADTLLGVTSEKGTKQHAGKEALGPPNVMPQGGSNPCAWAPAEKNDYTQITVGFSTPQETKQLIIAESHNPGCIRRIYVYDEQNNKYEVPEFERFSDTLDKRMLHVSVSKDLSIKAVQLKLAGERRDGWPEIDAIGLTNSSKTFTPEIDLATSHNEYKKAVNLGEKINSPYDEVNPVISADPNRLYFVRKKHPRNIGGKNGSDDIWYLQRRRNGWGTPKHMGTPLNTKGPNAIYSGVSGKNVIALRDNYSDFPNRKKSICLAKKRPAGWEKPVPQKIENFYNSSQKSSFFLCNDGKTLLMAIERDDSYGGLDLYVSFKKGENQWSEPENLGPDVNTAADEITPFLAADGQKLYFSTKGYRGYGNNDIFMTRKKENGWFDWRKPVNLGKPMNSESWDAYLTLPVSGQYGYFVSYRNTQNMADIYRIRIPQKIQAIKVEEQVLTVKPNQPLKASVIKQNVVESQDIISGPPPKADYKAITPGGDTQYTLTNKQVHMAPAETFSNFKLDSSLEVGQTITLDNIFFEFNKAKLKSNSFAELDKVYSILQDHPEMEIEIAGHTDSVGSKTYNQELSKERAQSVQSYLVEKGIAKKRIKIKGYGESKPIAPNKTEKGREKNRRVTFTILKK